jgi:hypothetical protein
VGIASTNGQGDAYSDPSKCFGEAFRDDGNSYVMKCDFTGAPQCTCLVNGVVTKTLATGSCLDLTPCDFPH